MKSFLYQLKVVLEEPVNKEEPMSYKMAKRAYKACMDDAELEVSLVPKCINKKCRGLPGPDFLLEALWAS